MYFLCQQYRTINFANSSNWFSEKKWIYTLNDLCYSHCLEISLFLRNIFILPILLVAVKLQFLLEMQLNISEPYSQICAIWDYALSIANLGYMIYKIYAKLYMEHV